MGAVVQKLSSSDKSSEVTNLTVNTTQNTKTQYTKDQIATHSTKNDCWLIIDGSVYDVSSYLNEHPGGVAQVTPFCGKDATQAFATMNGRGSHSSAADQIKQKYLVGTLSN